MADMHSKSTARCSTPAPQILQATNTNDGTCWHVFVTAAQLVPAHQRAAFTMRVLSHLIDSPATRAEVVMACCDRALVDTAVATDKWTPAPQRQRGSAALLPLLLLAAAAPVWAWQATTYFLAAALVVAVVGAVVYVDDLLCVRRRAQAQLRNEAYARQLRSLDTAQDVRLWRDVRGQDIAEYAVMLAVILVIVIGTIHMVGSNSNNVFSSVASSMQ